MLQSTRIEKRQSEVRERLAALAGTEKLTDEQRSEMEALDVEYGDNEKRKRAALIAEDEQREQAGRELETRDGKEWDKLVSKYELRQAALYLDEGREPTGETAEVVQEMRSQGGYRGIPLPTEILETRAGETTSGGIPSPEQIKGITPRLFPQSVAAQMGARMVSIPSGSQTYPVTTSAITAGWASSEGGDVAGPTQYEASGNTLSPANTLGIQLDITRQALKQTAGIETTIREDIRGTVQAELDKAVFNGSGSSGQPAGVIAKASSYGINEKDLSSSALDYATVRGEIAAFMNAYAVTGPGSVNLLMHPDVWDAMDSVAWDAGSGISELDRLTAKIGRIVVSANATPSNKKALLTTSAGVSPIVVGIWGGVDLIRDPYSNAASGGLKLTALVTMDCTITRAAQSRVIKGISVA